MIHLLKITLPGFIYNEKKSKCMLFKARGLKLLHSPSVYLNGKPLDYTQCHKYLGVVISDDLLDDNDIKRQI